MEPQNTHINIGDLLIAQPFMTDVNFKRAALLLCDHNDTEGTLGFVLNKTIDMNITDLIGDFPAFDGPVYYGGPVGTDTIHYIHDQGDILEESIPIQSGLYWGGDFDKLKFLISNDLIKSKNIRFFIGYSGWSAGQLKEELQHGSWIKTQLDLNYIFQTDPGKLWKEVLDNKGNTYSVIAQMPDRVILN